MKKARLHTKGFTLIASLLLLLLLSGMAIGLMMMVNTEGKVGGSDLQNNLAFHAAEGGIEKMYSDLSQAIKSVQAPTIASICGVSSLTPTMTGVTFPLYQVQATGTTSGGTTVNCNSSVAAQQSVTPGCPGQSSCWGQISSGPDAGLFAQVMPISMTVTASTMGGQEVSMTRQAQIALIPVFQFGVFSESDLSFFSGPNFDMVGPVHTNGDLYPLVGPGSTLTFHNQVSAYGNVVRTQLANGYNTSTNYNGTVYIPTASPGCSTTTSSCAAMPTPNTSSPYGDGSVQGAGGNPPQSSYNTSNWNTFSQTTTHFELINGNYGSTTNPGTGAKNLALPFVNGTNRPYQIIRRPPASESATSLLGQSREYNMAQIHVLLADDPAELPGGASDSNNVRLANVTPTQLNAQNGITTITTGSNPFGIQIGSTNYDSTVWGTPAAGNYYSLYFAAASNAVPIPSSCISATSCSLPDWTYAPWPFAGQSSTQGLQPTNPHPFNAGVVNSPAFLTNDTTGYNYPGGTPATPPAIAVCPPTNTQPSSIPATCLGAGIYPYYAFPNASTPVVSGNSPQLTYYNSANANGWSLIDGYLRVEYVDSSGVWHPVTNEWLQLGFARGLTPPTANGGGLPATGTTNPITPNAILLLQRPANRAGAITTQPTKSGGVWPVSQANSPVCTATNGGGQCTAWRAAATLPVPLLASDAGTGGQWAFGITPNNANTNQAQTPQSLTQYNWYPINFYDAREGEVRDTTVSNDSCTTNGVMNAVEIDVGNLKRWLAGSIGSSGTSVDYAVQNGYVLYFSDRRGMLVNPALNYKSGDSGLEDVINGSVAAGTPNGTLEPIPTGKTLSPEDVNQNGVLDTYGAQNLGLGFYGTQGSATKNLNLQINGTTTPDPFGTAANARIASCVAASNDWVSGARHVLRLVDGSLGNLPLSPNGGGFTVASENPVYILGNYNTNATDTVWTTGVDVTSPAHAPASVIADSVTLLSNNWLDTLSMANNVTTTSNRPATTTYYRVAIAGGKNVNFPQPTWSGVPQDFGTDGGVHNFLRYLEDWGSATLNYKGSIVSLYYSTYATGIYKCCTDVYSPPTRNYSFDLDFTSPAGLPPGTPMFKDVESLSYRQLFAARGLNGN